LPRLRAALVEWSARDPELGLRLVERCKDVLGPEVADEVAIQLVLPRLRSEVDGWDPRVDKASPHLWIHPWLAVLGRRLESLWAPIRFKLSSCLERWDPCDRSALEMLRPWQRVFDPGNWEPLMEKVLMRLERVVANLDVRPDGQDIEPIKDLLAWNGLAPADALARVLDVAMFPQWHKALREWLRTPGCDFAEVLQWYQGWKALLEALKDQGPIQRQMAHGLEFMKHFMAKGAGAAVEEEPPSPTAPDAEQSTGLPQHRAMSSGAGAEASRVAMEEVSLSLSDYLAQVSGEEGLLFRPKKAFHLGKQVYQFGSASIYVEKNLVYVAPKSGGQDVGEWRLVSMDELLRLGREAEKKPPGKR